MHNTKTVIKQQIIETPNGLFNAETFAKKYGERDTQNAFNEIAQDPNCRVKVWRHGSKIIKLRYYGGYKCLSKF